MRNPTEQLARCFVCGQNEFAEVFGGKVINKYQLEKCLNCEMVQAFPLGSAHGQDYSDYGDYLLLGEEEIRRRISHVARRFHPIFLDLRARFGSATLLDMGSGAGYFWKSASDFGFTAYGVEPSKKLAEFAKNYVGFQQIYERVDMVDQLVDAVFMFDVIEHLPPSASRGTMTKVLKVLKPGGLFIGNTPNFESANIHLCKDRDPVVAPPSHMCYFSPRTLDKYLASLSLTRLKLYSRGLSSNSFFRGSKFEQSFLEKSLRCAPLTELPFLVALRMLFAAAGYLLQPLGWGYQIYFIYQKKN